MFGRVKAFFGKGGRGTARAAFDAAATTRDNRRHWEAASSMSADGEASAPVRRTLRNRARYEVANNSYARGLVQMLANDTFGSGPRLQYLSDSEEANDAVESAFSSWCEAAKLTRKLRIMRIGRCQDGEAFAALTHNPRLDHAVKLDVTPLEADRVTGELSGPGDDNEVDGIWFDDWGNPLRYRVLTCHPRDGARMDLGRAVTVPARFMLHTFRADRPEQHRGVPELTAALPLFAQLRRYNLAVLSAAEAAADFSAVLYTDSPPDGQAEALDALDAVPLERNMMVTIPAGWKLGQLEAKHPASHHAEFVKIILGEIARCMVTTYGSLAGDFSGHNYASGRLDNQIYQKSVTVDRTVWEQEVLNPVLRHWLREFRLLPHGSWLPEARWQWFWDGFPHADPVKEASAQGIRLRNMTTTIAEECARDGRDYMAVLRQLRKERELCGDGVSAER